MNRKQIEEEIFKMVRNKFDRRAKGLSRTEKTFADSLVGEQKLQYCNIILANDAEIQYHEREAIRCTLTYFLQMLSSNIFFD